MSRKRDRCTNCGKPMRRLYMQKNKPTGSRGMVATAWFCETCNFSDIVTKFNENKWPSENHPALVCKCNSCGSNHKKIPISQNTPAPDLRYILEQVSKRDSLIEGLVLINSLDNASEYLGIVLGAFIQGSDNESQLAKQVFNTHATELQKNVINSISNTHRKRGWNLIHGKRFKQKVVKNGIELEQIIGTSIILSSRITNAIFKAIEMLESPEIYIDAAIENNPRLARAFLNKEKYAGDAELVEKCMTIAIKAGDYDLLENYVTRGGTKAAKFIIDLIKETNNKGEYPSYKQKRQVFEALVKTENPEAALTLFELAFSNRYSNWSTYYGIECEYLKRMGDKNSKEPIIRAIASDYSGVDDLCIAFILNIDDYGQLKIILSMITQGWVQIEESEVLELLEDFFEDLEYREVSEFIPSDYEKIKNLIIKATGFNSSFYKQFLLKKDPDGMRKFLFSDDPALRLMGLSMGKTSDIDSELEEFIFIMSFFDSEKTVKEGATDLLKEKGFSKETDIFDLNSYLWTAKTRTWMEIRGKYNWYLIPKLEKEFIDNSSENLKRLLAFCSKDSRFFEIVFEYERAFFNSESDSSKNLKLLLDYNDSKFLTNILEHLHEVTPSVSAELMSQTISLLKSSYPKQNERINILINLAIEKAPSHGAKTAVTLALNIDKQKTGGLIKKLIKMERGKERSARKQSVNRRLMFIDFFEKMITSDDIPYIQELMKKDRSPRVKKRFAQVLMNIS